LNYAPEQKGKQSFFSSLNKILQKQSSLIGVIIKGKIGAELLRSLHGMQAFLLKRM